MTSLPAHLALLHEIDNDSETQVSEKPKEGPKFGGIQKVLEEHIFENPQDTLNQMVESPSLDSRLAQLLQPELIPDGKQYLRHHMVICLVNMLTLSSFMGMRGLLTTLYEDVGLYALSLFYSWYALTTIMVASQISAKLGPRSTVVVAIVCQCVFLISNFLDCHATVLAGAGLAGFGSSLVYASQSTYEKSLSVMYASVTETNFKQAASMFTSVTRLFNHGSVAIGNLIVGLVLHFAPYLISSAALETKMNVNNFTRIPMDGCPDDMTCSNVGKPEQLQPNALYTVFGCTLLLALCILVCVTGKLDVIYRTKCSGKICQPAVLGIFMMYVQPTLLLTLGMAIYIAYVQALLFGDFLKIFIACLMNVEYIGYVMLSYAVLSCATSSLCATLRNIVGRRCVNLIGFIVSCAMLITLYTWAGDVPLAYFLVFIGLGASDGLLNTQLEDTITSACRHHGDQALTLVKVIQAGIMAVELSATPLLCLGTRILIAFGLLGLALGTSLAMEGVKQNHQRRVVKNPNFANL